MLGALSMVSVGNGLLGLLISLRLKAEGFDEDAIGFTVSAYAVGFFVACFLVPRVIRRFRHIPTLAGSVAVFAAVTFFFPVHVDPLYWFILRFVTGAAAAGAFVVGESWLNETADGTRRGAVFSLYMITGRIAGAGGQALFLLGDIGGAWLFFLAALCVAAALVPAARVGLGQLAAPDLAVFAPHRLYAVSPVGVFGVLASGLNNVALIGLAPAFAKERGFDDNGAALYLVAIMAGNLLIQYPVARIADRVDRRYVLILASALSLALAFPIIYYTYATAPFLAYGLGAAFGGISSTLYPLSVAHAMSRAKPEQIVAVSGGLLTIWSFGAIAGPMLAGWVMTVLGAGALFGFFGMICALLLFLVAARIYARPAQP